MSSYTDRDKGLAVTIDMPPLEPETKSTAPVEQEIAPQVLEEPEEQVEQEIEQEEVQEPEERPAQKESRANARIRELAEEKKRAERERDELMRLFMQQQNQSYKPVAQQEEDPDDFDIDDDSLVEGKSLRKMHKEMREIKKQLKSYQSRSAEEQQRINQEILETKIKAAHPDFDAVVSKENVETFAALYPELAATLASNKDPYSQAKSAYVMFKQMGIYKSPSIENERIKALKNAAKPRPLASIGTLQGESPVSRENAFANAPLTEEVKKKYYAEMIAAMKG